MTDKPKTYTPEEKLKQSLRLYHSARELKKAVLKIQYPHLDEGEIELKVKEIFFYANS